MSSETDLSTADLAQPGGTRQPDRADDDQRDARSTAGTDERTYETSGNRVQDPADEDTVELGSSGVTGGSTRDDAVREDTTSAGADRDMGDRDMGDRDMGGDMADRDMGDRGMAGQGATDRDMGDQGMGDQGMGGQGATDRDMGGQGATDRDMGGQGMTDRDAGDRGMAGQSMPGQGMADRDSSGGGAGGDVALLAPADADGFRQRWSDAQTRFVDDPREAVQTADGLVAELMQTLASSFSQHRSQLEAHWNSGGDPDTEDLRQALQRYRSFFDRLLSA